jgi:hypothetical protein
MSYSISYTILVNLSDDLSLPVLQGVGRLGRRRGKEDINIHLLKPAWFAVDPLCFIPPHMSAYFVQDDREDPGEEYLTYANRTSHPFLWWLPTKLAEWIGANFC